MKIVNFFKKITLAILGGSALSVVSSQAIILNFSDLTGSQIYFSGGDFFFTPTNSYQFDITSVTNGVGDSVGLNGDVKPGGPFAIGAISSTNITQNIPPFGSITYTIQSAAVTGVGTLNIMDTNGINLTGSIQWDNITSISSPFSSSGTLDLSGTINLTHLSYSGANSDLSALAAAGNAVDTVTFQFTSDQTLSDLVSSGGEGTSFSGSIASVPEPSSISLLAGLACCYLIFAFRRASKLKQKV